MAQARKVVITCAVIAGLAYGAMVALVVNVEPETREMRVPVPLDRVLETPRG